MIHNRILFQEPGLAELRKEYAMIDMHVHSKYSHDTRTPLKSILNKAEKQGIGVAITDHVRAEGALEACKQRRVMIIPGIEVNSKENKELLLYFYSAKDLEEFYEKYVKNNRLPIREPRTSLTRMMRSVRVNMGMSDIIEKADKYSCLKSIPHPYTYPPRRSHRFFARRKQLLRKVDAVEVMNASLLPRMNRLALRWASKFRKCVTGGSDAHLIREVGHVVVACKAQTTEEFLDCIKKKKNLVIGSEVRFSKAAREFIKTVRTKKEKYA
ncbi:MAG TPA: PHP domain-containing protein [Candidatus Woesearchaeota archaeon]|nr:PHP domain-containing protein [Candidatus Woesearchaeota archaeon]